jgi:hypothetical protein
MTETEFDTAVSRIELAMRMANLRNNKESRLDIDVIWQESGADPIINIWSRLDPSQSIRLSPSQVPLPESHSESMSDAPTAPPSIKEEERDDETVQERGFGGGDDHDASSDSSTSTVPPKKGKQKASHADTEQCPCAAVNAHRYEDILHRLDELSEDFQQFRRQARVDREAQTSTLSVLADRTEFFVRSSKEELLHDLQQEMSELLKSAIAALYDADRP